MQHSKFYYGLIGNGETAALIDSNLTVGWFCPGRFDDFPLFAQALDPERGGGLSLTLKAVTQLQTVQQYYIDRTNLLQTVLTGANCQGIVTDTLPWGEKVLLRRIELQNSGLEVLSVQIAVDFQPIATKYGRVRTFTSQGVLYSELTVAPEVRSYLTPGQSGQMYTALGGTFPWAEDSTIRLEPGEKRTVWLALAYGTSQDQAGATLKKALTQGPELVEKDILFWRQWLAQAREITCSDPEMVAAYYRSLLVLKLLTYEPTGAIIAAPTASFPATPGGWENWDYRYAWLRDGYYCGLAFDQAGFHQEARRFLDFVATLQQPDGSWSQPLYTVTGHNPTEYIIPDLTGPNGERPVRFGNKAAEQLQLDNTGNVLDGLWQHYSLTQDRDYLATWWPRVVRGAQWVTEYWQEPEHGIWELREKQVHWVHGKAMCVAALEAAAKVAQVLGYHDFSSTWQRLAMHIAVEAIEKGWSPQRQAFLQYYGAPAAPVDISVLALEFYQLLPADDWRLRSTVEIMEKPADSGGLQINGGIARYEKAAVPFYLPTFWLARYYSHFGQVERAWELVRLALQSATNLYLMAEHFDPLTSTQWGNFPQAFSHEELVQTLLDLEQRHGQNTLKQG